MTSIAEKVRENRLREAAKRQGLELSKSRRRDPRALDFGRWQVIDASRGAVVAECDSIDEVESYLDGERS